MLRRDRRPTAQPQYSADHTTGENSTSCSSPSAPRYKGALFNWEDLFNKRIPAPYVPPISDPMDSSNFDPYSEDDRVTPYHGDNGHFEGF